MGRRSRSSTTRRASRSDYGFPRRRGQDLKILRPDNSTASQTVLSSRASEASAGIHEYRSLEYGSRLFARFARSAGTTPTSSDAIDGQAQRLRLILCSVLKQVGSR